ncbi:Fur family transcriptional regulator [Bacillus sp. B15-48]|uniref:transcriptional repressor n=1 Tax=Bacillus sp. B15-48 TaxID=1548601 RepID=UPI0019401F92|nr:transcriptional repressor [Bacillus sp. B15-48]
MSSLFSEAIDKLKSSGIKLTPQRNAILEYLFESLSHPTADDIFKAIRERFPSMSVTTVYNTLRTFEEVGLVKKMDFGDSFNHYCCLTTNHYHVICQECGKIVNFFYPALNEIESFVEQSKGFKVTHHQLEVYGICSECNGTKPN